MRCPRLLLASFVTVVVHVACSSPPDAAPRPSVVAETGVQVWNHTAAPRTVLAHAIDAEGASRLVATVVVPGRRDLVDPSLGGDPRAVHRLAIELREGEHHLRLVDDLGRATSLAMGVPDRGWAIVFVGADRLEALADTGPRGLD